MKIILIFVAIVLVSCNQSVKEVYQWRGSDRSGRYPDEKIAEAWPEDGPQLLWKSEAIGMGYGSPVITEDRIFIVGTTDSTSYLFAFDKQGIELYQKEIGKEWVNGFPGSRGTPTLVGNDLYVFTGQGVAACFNAQDGHLRWKKNLLEEYDGVHPRFGYSQSPVISDELIIFSIGNEEKNVVALDRDTGEEIWSSAAMGERPAYTPANLIRVGERDVFVTFSAYHLLGIDAQSGELLWTHEQVNTPLKKRRPGAGDTHANTVLFDDDMLYYVAGDGNCAVALKLSEDGDSIEQIWNNAAIDNFMGGILIVGDYLYSSAHSKQKLLKIDKYTGAVKDELDVGRGSVIEAGGKLIYYNQQGEVYLVDIEGATMQVVSQFKVEQGSKEHFAHPVVESGVLYVRHGEFLGAYKL